jgi:tetratricopeptide (TPR) repeat protein
MAIFWERKDRKVIPRLRDFDSTIANGEFTPLNQIEITKDFNKNLIKEQINDWRANKEGGFAADLLSSAFVLGLESEPETIQAAEFILANANEYPFPLKQLAERISIGNATQMTLTAESSDGVNLEIYSFKIHYLRNELSQNPYNAINWVELARSYTILGKSEKAIRAMIVATSLAPNNRYVLRSSVSLYNHLGDVERAHDLIRKKTFTKLDPWLL